MIALQAASVSEWPKSKLPPPPAEGGYDFDHCTETVNILAQRVSRALDLATQKQPPKPVGRPGRTRSVRLVGSFDQFVLRLLWNVREAGGQLTLDKNSGHGTLMRALELLRPHLPPMLVPHGPALSSLQRLKTLGQKYAGRLEDVRIFGPVTGQKIRL
jgi:hypothetical protein